eukprot:TRINITY_DN4066_c0_g2_i1.p4 TRINITY_DN4066_c0_g2~~TRINITY_DN4066_c0_g2_i1.p4  ORF type:complete len:117 (-),score=11.36 TRINITY_DN4066_c0_g2_i1:291-641(-)
MKNILFQVLLIACLLFGSCYGEWCSTLFGTQVYIAEDGAKVRKAASTNSGLEATLDIDDGDKIKLLCWTKGQYVSDYGNDEWVQVCFKWQTAYMHDGVLDCNNELCRTEYGLKMCD